MKKATLKLDPNSTYHQILIKKYGATGALAELRRSSLMYALDMVDYRKILSYQARTPGGRRFNKTN
jgi:hypothetical protein